MKRDKQFKVYFTTDEGIEDMWNTYETKSECDRAITQLWKQRAIIQVTVVINRIQSPVMVQNTN